METKTITITVLPGQYFLSSVQRDNVNYIEQFEINKLFFLFSEKLDSGKWKVNFSFERTGKEYYQTGDRNFAFACSSSDVISFVVEPENEIRLANYFTTSVSETVQDITLFGNVKEKQHEIKYNFDYLVFKEIGQDSITVETHWMRQE